MNNKILEIYRWSIRNHKLWKYLNGYGCIPNKSLQLIFPDKSIFHDEVLIRHFIRGYFDGDGCICFTPKTKIISVLGTKEFLNGIKLYIPYWKDSNFYKHGKNNTFMLQSNFKKAYKILKFLYDDASIFLDRKYDKYLDFCRLYKEL